MQRLFIFALPFLLFGCASSKEGDKVTSPEPMSVCIENATVGRDANLIARARTVTFNVDAGKTVCKDLNEYGPKVPLRAGGFSVEIDPFTSSCWHWKIMNTSESLLTCEAAKVTAKAGS